MKSRGEMFMNKMKDSGIKWIGDSPIEWNKFTIGQLFEQVKQKNTGLIEKIYLAYLMDELNVKTLTLVTDCFLKVSKVIILLKKMTLYYE